MSPTFEAVARFRQDYSRLTPDERKRFKRAVEQFVDDLQAQRLPRPGLRVKRVQGAAGVWELTWAPDGRATFARGAEVKPGEPHIVWRRIGTHEIFGRP